jgi:penicillin amidase
MASRANLRRVAGAGLAGLIGLAGLAGAGAFAALRRPLPRASGALRLPGLGAPARVLRDRWGVPHIYAASSADLFMAQGFVHAQDRLWQMELQRRTGHGRLSELFGEIALDSDRFVRIMGFPRVARRELDTLGDDARAAVEAYVRGVNAFLEQSGSRLPIEFTILRARPEPWQPLDVLVWGKMLAQNLARSWITEALRAQIVAAVGPERAAALEPEYLAQHPLTLPRGVRYSPELGGEALRLAGGAAPFVGNGEAGQGSNGWVVGGGRTVSGRPLLANDVHLALQLPSLWYENHLSGGEYHVTGASLPGTPGVVLGHNERIAWGITNGENDVQDLFVERFDPADPTRYEFRGAWEPATIVHEEIQVKGRAAPHVEQVRITRHGPVISGLLQPAFSAKDKETRGQGDKVNPDGDASLSPNLPGSLPQELALRWTALDPSQPFDAALAVNRARDWESFRAAAAGWTSPTLNFVYADVEGHVGYVFGGHMPIRAQGDGRLPVPGWTGEHEWTGVIPPDELPYALDPPDGALVTANNRIVGDEFPYPMPSEYLPGYRAARIRQLIEQTPRHDPRSFAGIQRDQRSLPGLELAALAGRLPAMGPLAQRARDALAAWDGELTADSVGGAIYARLREKLLAGAYAEVAGPLAQTGGLGAFAGLLGDTYLWRALPLLLKRLAARDDSWLAPGRSGDALLREAWAATVVELRDELGDDVREWRYGRFHRLTLRHPLGGVPALAPLFNRGPFPTGGDADTVRMGYAPRHHAGVPFYVAPSYRQICDPSNWDNSQSIHPGGQSGQPSSRHYADYVQPYLNMQYHPMPWSRARVEDAAVSRLVLEP